MDPILRSLQEKSENEKGRLMAVHQAGNPAWIMPGFAQEDNLLTFALGKVYAAHIRAALAGQLRGERMLR